jgi:hypothetical protein
MKYLFILLFMLSANVFALQECPRDGCDYTVTCSMTDGDGTVNGSFSAGGQNYAVAGAMFIYVNNGYQQFYKDLTELAGDKAGEYMIPDIDSPLTPLLK